MRPLWRSSDYVRPDGWKSPVARQRAIFREHITGRSENDTAFAIGKKQREREAGLMCGKRTGKLVPQAPEKPPRMRPRRWRHLLHRVRTIGPSCRRCSMAAGFAAPISAAGDRRHECPPTRRRHRGRHH